MTRVAIVLHSTSGYTRLAGEAVLRGVRSRPGTDAALHEITPERIINGRWSDDELLAELDGADAIVFGSPTHFGGVSAEMKAFFDSTLDRYLAQAWKDKVGAGFTVSSTPSGDKLQTLVSMATFALQMGMIWVGLDQLPMNADGLNRLSFYFGAGVLADYRSEEPAIDGRDERTAELLGARVAAVTDGFVSGRDAG